MYVYQGLHNSEPEGSISIKEKDGTITGYDVYVATNQGEVMLELVCELLDDLRFPYSITEKTEKCKGIRLKTRDPRTVLRFYEGMLQYTEKGGRSATSC